MTKIKICGITNTRDARECLRWDVDFLGFVFYKGSPRFITPAKARAIIRKIDGPVLKVGVFVNERPERVKKIARTCGLDVLQFHGAEDADYLRQFKEYRLIKALRVKKGLSGVDLKNFNDALILFDTFAKKAFGGTGKVFNWECLGSFKKKQRRFIVSGGLTPENVGVLVKKIRPFGVDVSSGVERTPGKKDPRKVEAFVKAVRTAASRGSRATG